jgi:diaminohydroxyphosphoribosylaminopyrimidine deaminase/5-amino-6-(5-phosphoribosylamino)uracil reductase
VRAFAHLLRARVDAIVVGRKTVVDDNPQLTCRLPGMADRSPLRVVLDPSFQTLRSSNLVRSAGQVPVMIFGAAGNVPPAFPAGVSTEEVRATGRALDLADVLGRLHARGITRVMVEGGPTVARAFLQADLVDEVMIARGAELLRARGRKPLVDAGIELFADASRWEALPQRAMGDDWLFCYRRRDRLATERGGAAA